MSEKLEIKREVFELLRPRLTGARFNQHSIPPDLLRDLSYLESFLKDVARWIYLEDHPDRKNIPRGFFENISLDLFNIGEGSAIPSFALVYEKSLLDHISVEFFVRAKDAIIDAINAATKGLSVTDFLPEKSLAFFDKIGRSLRDNEAIEFSPDTEESPARLDKISRRQLLEFSKIESFTEEKTFRCALPTINQDKMTYSVQLIDGTTISSNPIEAQYYDQILDAIDGFRKGRKVQLAGIVSVNRNGKWKKIESLDSFIPLDSNDIGVRLDQLSLLKQGWLDGKGKPLAKNGLQKFEHAFISYFPENLEMPFIYPTPEGGLSLEWDIEKDDVSLEVDLNSFVAILHRLNLDTEEEHEYELSLDRPEGWQALISILEN